ncbi:MAG: thioesterase family protein [Myxococcota bacterium]
MPFFETDAMGVVHHSNYVRWLEVARIQWLAEHHRPYAHYVEAGRHFAVIRLEIDYRLAVGFDEEVAITVWPEWVKGATLRMAYRLATSRGLVAPAVTEHAMVDTTGRARRIPREEREALRALCGDAPSDPRPASPRTPG